MSGHAPGGKTTRALIEFIVCSEAGAKLRSQVAGWHPGSTPDEVEDAFQEACVLAQRSCRGQTEGEVFVWLRTTTHRELGHLKQRAWRRARVEVLVDNTELEAQPTPGTVVSLEDALIDLEDHAEVERVSWAVLDRLSARQREVAVLHSHGRRRPEIAEHLGMTPRSVKRTLERVMAVGRAELVRLAGHGCEAGEELVSRFAFGLASPREMGQAQLHLASCRTCAGLYERLDLWREKVAVVLPVPAVEQAHPGILERTLHGAADTLSTVRRQVTEAVGGAREHTTDGATHFKQHVTSAYYRSVDPTPLAGVRPGAAAATIASCLAIGGGATYCAQQGVDPLAGLSGVIRADDREQRSKAPKKVRVAQAQTPETVVATPVATTPTPQPAATATPSPAPTAQPVVQSTPQPTLTPYSPPPTPQDEYEPVNSIVPSSSARQASPAAARPMKAPVGGPGEFDGP